jgi:hypothetical protein
MLGFLQLASNQLVGRHRLKVVSRSGASPAAHASALRSALKSWTMRNRRSQRVDRDARIRRERPQVLHHLRRTAT